MTRTLVIEAPPNRVWPLLLQIRDIQGDEGRWNLTQDVLGVPRPTDAHLEARDGRHVRVARWGADIRFEEQIVAREEHRLLAWRFVFPDPSVREHTDRHIAPDGGNLTIREGAYRLRSLPGERTEVTLETRYTLRTPVNFYAAWWGEWMLGDIQNNILGIIKDRAEGRSDSGS